MLVAQSCPTLCDPKDCNPPVIHESMGFSREEYWSGLPCTSPGDLPDPGIEPSSPVWQADSLSYEPQGSLAIFKYPPQIPLKSQRMSLLLLPLKKRSHCLGFVCSISPCSYNWPNGAPFYRLENRGAKQLGAKHLGAKQLGTLTTRAHLYSWQNHDDSFIRLTHTVEIILCARCCDGSVQTSVETGILAERTARGGPPR